MPTFSHKRRQNERCQQRDTPALNNVKAEASFFVSAKIADAGASLARNALPFHYQRSSLPTFHQSALGFEPMKSQGERPDLFGRHNRKRQPSTCA
jgi:hypothetical protein